MTWQPWQSYTAKLVFVQTATQTRLRLRKTLHSQHGRLSHRLRLMDSDCCTTADGTLYDRCTWSFLSTVALVPGGSTTSLPARRHSHAQAPAATISPLPGPKPYRQAAGASTSPGLVLEPGDSGRRHRSSSRIPEQPGTETPKKLFKSLRQSICRNICCLITFWAPICVTVGVDFKVNTRPMHCFFHIQP